MTANTFLALILYMFAVAMLFGWLFLDPSFAVLHFKLVGMCAAIFGPMVLLHWRADKKRERNQP